MNNITSATEYYKDVLKQDNTHVEAIACIGSNHFYTDQPEIALRFYRLSSSCTVEERALLRIGGYTNICHSIYFLLIFFLF